MSLKKFGSGLFGTLSSVVTVAVAWAFYESLFVPDSTAGVKNPWLLVAILIVAISLTSIWFFRLWLERSKRLRLERAFGKILQLGDCAMLHYLCQFGQRPFFACTKKGFKINPEILRQLNPFLLGETLAEFLRIWTGGGDDPRGNVFGAEFEIIDRLADQMFVSKIPQQRIDYIILGLASRQIRLAEELERAAETLSREREISRIQMEIKTLGSKISKTAHVRHRLEQDIVYSPTAMEVLFGWLKIASRRHKELSLS